MRGMQGSPERHAVLVYLSCIRAAMVPREAFENRLAHNAFLIAFPFYSVHNFKSAAPTVVTVLMISCNDVETAVCQPSYIPLEL